MTDFKEGDRVSVRGLAEPRTVREVNPSQIIFTTGQWVPKRDCKPWRAAADTSPTPDLYAPLADEMRAQKAEGNMVAPEARRVGKSPELGAGYGAMASNPEAMPANPKQVFGDAKLPLSLVSSVAIAEECLACLEGNLKYGLANYRGAPVEAMTYIKAGERHRRLYMEGEDRDPLTGVHHLAYSRACDGIILDATAHSTLIDNRPKSGAYNTEYMAKLAVTVLRIRELYGDKNPKHYTIADNEGSK